MYLKSRFHSKRCSLCIVLLFSVPSLAQSLLTCHTSGAGGSLFKKIVLEKSNHGLVVLAESYNGRGLTEIKISKFISTSVSLKYYLDVNNGLITSLVIYNKQAVVVYEEKEKDKDHDQTGPEVEFFICK